MKISYYYPRLISGLFISFVTILTVDCTGNSNDKHLRFASAVSSLHTSGDEEKLLYIPEGLRAELWAESPQFYNPANIDVDHQRRIWVTEVVNYRTFNNDPEEGFKHFEKGDRVTGSGRYHKLYY